jgi:signal transduction histidine kinase
MSGGLTRRTILASALLALLVGAAFAALVRAIDAERGSADLATHSQQVLAVAHRLERLVLDLETGQRGFVATRDERFLGPWTAARMACPGVTRELVSLATDTPNQRRRARQIAAAVESYVRDYSVPDVNAELRGDGSNQTADLLEGKRRVDALRGQFDRFVAAEHNRYVARETRSRTDGRRAIVAATAGLVGSMLLIVAFGTYLTRAIALPVRRAAAMAGRLAGGELSARMPETGTGEVGDLQRAFNTMGASLEKSSDELRQLADEQAALRRVATLVARAVPPATLLRAVVAEVGRLLAADSTRMLRYEPDGKAVGVASQSEPGLEMPEGSTYAPEGRDVATVVLCTRRPARMDTREGTPGSMAAMDRERGVRWSVGAPIVVEDRLWGVMVASWRHDNPLPDDTEQRMAQFTDLVATAIANASNRAELAASRARVVTTADETRRRLQRDLHDGAQQRLVHTIVTLKLARHSLGAASGPAVDFVEEALAHAERANAELRELAHGILPAALSRGGLRGGVSALVSHVTLPVTIDVTPERLPPPLEATAYFIVAEALTNTVKHAQADSARISAVVDDGVLRLEVRDDGIGGATPDGSSGLVGLRDRAAAMNGELRVDSPPGGGTVVSATLPIA